MSMLSFIMENWDIIVQGVLTVVGGFALLATVTPTKADDKVVDTVLKVIHTFAGNFGKAKNKE